jgi:predicted glycogen debranching enzyme
MTPLTRVGWVSSEQQAGSDALTEREWLVTNGLGGYASGTISGVVTRRYHSLLVAALPNPFGRTTMLDHLSEELRLPNGAVRWLSSHERDPEAPQHHEQHLERFELQMGLPVWIYRVDGFLVEKRIVLTYLQNTVYVRYRLLEYPADSDGPPWVTLLLRPAMHFRPHDAPVSRPIDPYSLCLTGNRFEVSTPSSTLPSTASTFLPQPSLKLLVNGQDPTFEFNPEKQEKVNYRWESARGYESHGTLWSPGRFKVTVTADTAAVLVASTESWEVMNAIPPDDAWRYENERRARLLHVAPGALADTTTAELVLAADQFLIAPAGRLEDAARARAQGEELRSVIAGYHWFTDWGRDTMISLEGLALCTGRHQTAHFILHTFAQYVRKGLIPNLFPEGSQNGMYHTADATLWFFHALDRYLTYTSDHETLRLLLPTLEGIIDAHVRGTDFGIGVDASDGLLGQGQDGYALTWMDALCEGWVVTPRRGKAVEINALWFNALTLMGQWVQSERGIESARRFVGMAATTRESFNRKFWDEEHGRLFDVVDGPGLSRDDAFRPNQLMAIALPNAVLDRTRWQPIVDAAAAALLTPVGLRSLAPDQRDFKPNYHGDLRTRDAAYHQGTVWSWLIGPFVDAWLKVYPDARAEARNLLQGLKEHLGHACIGSVSEIFDAEAPFSPRGCIAQAWGVAEFLRAWRLTAPPS